MTSKYISLEELEVYTLSRQLSKIAWELFREMDWETKKIMGIQFIESVDSIGANIAEGYSRYHYLDRIKFYYNSRGSLSEVCGHWLSLLLEREKISKDVYDRFKLIAVKLSIKLNNFIQSTYNTKNKSQ